MPIKLLIFVAIIVAPVLLSACAGSARVTKTGDGFYKIVARQVDIGKGFDTENFAMLRAAELALDQGHPYFEVFHGNTVTSQMDEATPNLVFSTGLTYIPYIYQAGSPSNLGKSRTELYIQLLRERPIEGSVIWYDAEQVISGINSHASANSDN